MNKKLFLASALATLALAFASCTSLTYNERTIKTVDPGSSAHITPVVSDLDVATEKVTKSFTYSEKLSQTDVNQGPNSLKVKSLKSKALYDMADQLQVDVIVAPTYKIDAADNGTVTVTVSGFPATYKGFHKATPAEMDLLLKNDSLRLLTMGANNTDWQDSRIVSLKEFSRGPGIDLRVGAGYPYYANLGLSYYVSNKFSVGLEATTGQTGITNFGGLADARYYFSEKPLSPFVDLKVGAVNEKDRSYYSSYYGTRNELRFTAMAMVGVSFRYLDLGVGASMYSIDDPHFGIVGCLSYNIQLKKH